ncbi:MAG: hypothetical protein R3E76_00520 [Planctomycetota bacterium]
MRRFLPLLLLLSAVVAACNGEFDQRQDEAKTQGAGGSSTGTLPNQNGPAFIRGVVSNAGTIDDAYVTLRRINDDASIDFTGNIGLGRTFSNGIYQVFLTDTGYRGPILVEVRGGVGARGANPATALSNKFHDFRADHVMYGVVPLYDGYSVIDVNVSPLTTVAVGRCLAFDGSIAGVQGGIGTGIYGLVCQQVAEFFGLDGIRARQPADYSASGSFGSDDFYARVLAALSQVAKDLGVSNVFDFCLGLYQDALDDGELNGSIAVVPNTPLAMPDLGSGGLIGSALLNNYMDPSNLERAAGGDNTQVTSGSALDTLITTLDSVRDVDTATRVYDLTVRVPGEVTVGKGSEWATSIEALDQLGTSINFHPYGDSGGPSFVDFAWSSSSPANVSVLQYGRISVNAAAPSGNYTLTLTIQPAAGQTFVTGPTETHTITVRVP